MKTPRYIVIYDSQSAHCCFSATVVDTNKPTMIGDKQYKDRNNVLQFDSVCECFEYEHAEMIADALNAREVQS